MKHFILLTFFIIFYSSCFSQLDEPSRYYEIKYDLAIQECSITGQPISDSIFIPPLNSRFAVIKASSNNKLIINFLYWEKDTAYRSKFNISTKIVYKERFDKTPFADTIRDTKYFLLNRADLDSNCIKAYRSGLNSAQFTIGLVTMPTKLRLGKNFDFQGNLSLGTTAGLKTRISRYKPNYINYLIGLSISTITLDSFSTGGKVVGQPLTNIAVFSPSLGIVFEFGKAQAGIFYGLDFLNKSTRLKYDWIFNRKPWLSIGFGFSIFSIDSQTGTKQPNQN